VKALPSRISIADLRRVKPPEKSVDPYYLSPEHKAWRNEVIRRAGGKCQYRGHDPRRPRSGIRLFADHIRELKDGGDPLDPANGMACCGACHSLKTAAERRARSGQG